MQQVFELSVRHRTAASQTHEDLQGPPQGGHGKGHCRRHRWHHIWEKEEEEQVKGPTT